ncbi:pyridoxamine 5'-phosphate oxidase family protein [Rhodococcus sp. IEGM 1408]|uniref:pyridoxamine 5'-phosphate oxidase family protein n=1 Tax=Rhodococcus sp. IEGM 1408 TaxID=3082220 RepID=UPI002952C241|nr:pyridoxamine 5'-phosphate oxidase family protein [Rhodococcus sp. IEGM 1408]MDV8001501.1 pyridoxamine 5'-phosphate oxidase family protein [Rhodococcus sp. IEGM 1408]
MTEAEMREAEMMTTTSMPRPWDDPLGAMVAWLAIDPAAPPLGVLATVGPDGTPHCRHLLVSGATTEGPTFHTDSRSQKVRDLEGEARATLVVLSEDRTRQLTVTGTVVPTDPQEQSASYLLRSDYLKLLAWTNDAATALLPPPGRRRMWAGAVERFGPSPEQAPDTWLGLRLRPETVTFWTAGMDEPSHRRRFQSRDGSWHAEELPG